MMADLIVKGFSDLPTNCNDCRFCDRTMQQIDEITGQEYIGECNIGEFLLDKVCYPNDGVCPLYRTVSLVGTEALRKAIERSLLLVKERIERENDYSASKTYYEGQRDALDSIINFLSMLENNDAMTAMYR